MCHPAVCGTCGKMTWRGCGMHVQQVMAGVPKDEQCPGHTARGGSVLSRLLGRR